MTNLRKILDWNFEFTLQGISPARRHAYFYAVLVLGAVALNTLIRP
jgi:hypothetical protein